MLHVNLLACSAGSTLPLAISKPFGISAHTLLSHRTPNLAPGSLPTLPVGTCLNDGAGRTVLRVTGHIMLPARSSMHSLECPLVTACMDLPVGEISLSASKNGPTLAWVTLSDKGYIGQRKDESGPAIATVVREYLDLDYTQGFLLPDDAERLRALLTTLALVNGYDLIITTGGTGVGARDITPQTTRRVLDQELPGFSQAMLLASLAKTPHGAISRAAAGVLGRSIIINLPGSRKAVLENLEAIMPAVGHTLSKLHGDPSDCAQS